MKKRRGATTVEVAIIMIPLSLILMGIIEYGWFFFVLQTAQHASREGARTGCLMTSTDSDIELRVNQAINGLPHNTTINRNTTTCVLSVGVEVPYNEISLVGGLFGKRGNITKSTMITIEGCVSVP